ncbi:MAG: DUF4097 family beta strand repeat-containing protein [Candidatus Elarobacter sp.]
MISRSTLIGALVVVELAIVGSAVKAIAGDGGSTPNALGLNGDFGAFHGRASMTPLDRTVSSGTAPVVVVDVHDVDVVVQAGAASGVHVVETVQRSGYVSGAFAPITVNPTADGVRVAANGDSEIHVMIGHVSRQLKIVVPPAARVEVISGAQIDASGLRAKFIAHVEDGAIHVSDQRGDVDVSTGSGRIYLTDVQAADVAAGTSEGRLYFNRVGADRIDAHTNFGRIYATDLRAVDGALTTKEGRVSVSLAGNSDAVVEASVTDGNDIHTSGLTATDNGANKRSVKLGSGRGRFEVTSDDGSITLTQGANV